MRDKLRAPCIDCGAPIEKGSRCIRCQSAYERNLRGTPAERGYGKEWRALVTQVLREWRAVRGDLCPGLPGRVPPHPATDLVGDHIIAMADGGPALPGRAGVGVLCVRCNSKKGGGQHVGSLGSAAMPRLSTTTHTRRQARPPRQVWIR